MNEQTRIVKNTGILMGMELGMRFLDILSSVILARYLAPQGFGLMAFALAFVSLFSILAGFGLSTLTTRNLARDPEHLNRYLSNGLVAQASLSLVTLVLIGLTSWGMGYPLNKILVILLAAILMVIDLAQRFSTAFFQAAQRMGTNAILNLVASLLSLFITLLVVAFKGGLIEVLTWRAAGELLVLAILLWLIHRRLERIRWSFDPVFVWQMLKASIPFAFSRLFVAVYVDIDMVMVSSMRGDVMTGWYAAAQKFRKMFTFIPMSVMGAAMPAMSKFYKESQEGLVETLTRSCKYLILIALPIAGWISIMADRLILLFYGSAYQEAIPALRIVIWTILFAFLNSAMSSALLAVNRERQVSRILGFSALFNILSNLIAISLWGHIGAATTTVLSEFIVWVVELNLLRKALPQVCLLGELSKPIGATLVMMMFVWFGRGLGVGYTIIGSVLIYLGGLIASRAVGSKEWALLKGIFQQRGVASAL